MKLSKMIRRPEVKPGFLLDFEDQLTQVMGIRSKMRREEARLSAL